MDNILSKKQQIEQLKEKFLISLKQTEGKVLWSCARSGLSRSTALRHYKKDEEFRNKWNNALRREQNGPKTVAANEACTEAESASNPMQSIDRFSGDEKLLVCETESAGQSAESLSIRKEVPVKTGVSGGSPTSPGIQKRDSAADSQLIGMIAF